MPLRQFAAQTQQHLALLDFFNTFGNQLAPERTGEANHALQNGQIIRIVVHVAHKTLVNFEQRHRQSSQVGEGGVTRAEVVQRKLHADLAALFNHRRDAGDVFQRAGFQYLKFQVSGVNFRMRRPDALDEAQDEEAPLKGTGRCA